MCLISAALNKFLMKSPSKSCLLDPWPTFLVKECIDILLPSITRLVNWSLSEGVVPDEFKKAIVTPLIKKSSLPPNDFKNYRPASGLGFISKLVERVVASQLNDHVSLNGLENIRQSAYKLGHSTESALLSIKNDVHLAFARGEATAVVLLDQSAAFDTIDHDTLLDSLSSWFSVSGVVLDWFKSYLSDRVQCIKIGSILSDAKKLLYGMPQGSVLGPILFSLYTTPLSKVIQNHTGISFHFYADDTQLYVHLTHKNVASALDKLSRCLEGVKRWLSTNKLKLNPDKTEFIVFGSKSQREKLNHSFTVNILGNLISPVDAVRNLGVWFESDFSFSCHVMKVYKACFASVRDLKRLRRHLTHEATLIAANALVGSHLDYLINSLVSQFWICANFNVFRTVLPELLPTPPSIHTSLQLEKHYIGCRLSTVLSLRQPCLFTSSYTVVTPNTLNPFSYPDIVHITLVEVNLMACFLRVPTLLQFSSLKRILDSVSHMTDL